MTVSTTSSRTVLAGNATATVFPFPFACTDPTTISVQYLDPNGNLSTVSATSYSVTLNATPPGGSVTYTTPAGPIPNGSFLIIIRTVPLTQTVQIQNQGAFYPSVVTGEFDALVMADQQLADGVSRALGVPVSDPAGLNYTAPPVALRAGMIAGWDSNGNFVAAQEGAQSGDVSLTTAVASGSPTARSLNLRFADMLSVKDFGAKGDGVSDDTAAINAALTAAQAVIASTTLGASVWLPMGVYLISSTVVIPSNVSLIGAGRVASIIRAAAGMTTDMVQTPDFAQEVAANGTSGGTGFALRHLTLDGADATTSNGISIYGWDYDLEDIDILNCSGMGLFSQYQISSAYVVGRGLGATLRRVRAIWCRGTAGIMFNGPERSLMEDVESIEATQYGVVFNSSSPAYGGANTVLTGCRVFASGGTGLIVACPVMLSDIEVEGCGATPPAGGSNGGILVNSGAFVRGSAINVTNNTGDGMVLGVLGAGYIVASLSGIQAVNNSGDGVVIQAGALIADISAVQNAGNGITVNGPNVSLSGLRSELNTAAGVFLGTVSNVRLSGLSFQNAGEQINFGTLTAPATIDLVIDPGSSPAYSGTYADCFVRVAAPSGSGFFINQVQTT